MSISEFKPTLRDAIIKRLSKRFRAYTLDDLKALELDSIRTSTNKKSEGYQAVLTRANLTELARQFSNTEKFRNSPDFKKISDIAESVDDLASLANAAKDVLSNSALFGNFVEYLSGKSYSELAFNRRNTGKLEYADISEDIRLGMLDSKSISDRDILIFKENHGDLAKLFREFLGSEASGIAAPVRVLDFIKEQLDAGHLVGVFNIRFKKFFNLKTTPINGRPVEITEITKIRTNNDEVTALLGSLNNLLIQSDYLSSNSVADPDVFITAEKRVYGTKPEITVELQLSVINQEAGRKLSTISRQMNEIIKAVRGTSTESRGRIDGVGARLAVNKFMTSMVRLADDLKIQALALQKGIDPLQNPRVAKEVQDTLSNLQVVEKLLGTRGSPSIKESIEIQVINTILGKSNPAEIVSKAFFKEPGKKRNKLPPTTSRVAKKSTPKKYSARVSPLRNINTGRFYSLTNLQSLLDATLVERVKQNMGDGTRRDILNLRTGRFAESVKVERLSKSRAGMITAFYSYMRNPYATFSDGGRQQYPKTRDPKLLIAKSIREIAATQVGNRLRSVNV
jgi:hypothetical protein